MNRLIDETGNRYGKLVVIGYDKERKRWICKCDCGNIRYRKGADLRNHRYMSCGCGTEHKDLRNQKFGMLTPIEYNQQKHKWLCKCDCGNKCYVPITKLENGKKTNCGCQQFSKYEFIKKDERFKRLYAIHHGMKSRCYLKSNDMYKYYGGKGIKICDEWLGKEGFLNFFDWSIKNGYIDIKGEHGDKLSIDRIDSDKDYCPKNCRWITVKENSARTSEEYNKLQKKVEELNIESQDDLVQNYINRKMELKEIQLLEEPKKTTKGNFFFRKPNYCYLHNNDNTKQFLFRNYKNVALFLEISVSAVGYRVRNKNGIVAENWKLEKINKEDYDFYINKGIEVIK